MTDIKGGFLLWFCFLDKKCASSSVNMHANNEHPLNIAEQLDKRIIRKF